MFADFTFDGHGNDEYGVICVAFDAQVKNNYSGQKTELKTDISGSGREFEIYDQKYSEPMSFNFQIVNKDSSDISPEQERYISKWLCHRGEYSWMFLQEPRYADIYIKANISNPQIIVVAGVCGLEYTVTTSAATCFSDEHDESVVLTQDDNSFELYLFNDDECCIHPNLEITFAESGDFQLKNEAENSDYFLEIKGVTAGETITIEEDLFISSSIESHDVWNDFNKNWFRLYDDKNVITANLACTINLKYRETRRVIVY